jgi:PKHD-type hydroxylase
MGIIQHKKYYGINNLINTPLWNLIQKELNSSNLEWEDGAVGEKGYSKNTRKSKIAWISDVYLREQLFHSVDLYNKQNWNYDLDGCDGIQYGTYSDGGFYDWHVDEEAEIEPINGKYLVRKLSMTIWLNDPDEYEGGEFDIEIKGPREDIRYETLKLSKGSIIIFPSDKWHRVRPVTSGVRKSLVTWFRGPPFR